MNKYRVIGNVLAVLSFGLAGLVSAQSFPDRPITLVVPNPPGGLVDTSARLLSEPLTRVIGQTVVVDNKPGASGNIAYQYVANAKPDGYTLLISYSGYHVGNPALFDKLAWDPIKDFSPVALLTVSTNVIAVHPSVPVNNLKEFIAYAKANPGKLNYASQGNGSVSHIGTEIFKQTTGVEMVHVPYKGSGPAIQDVLAGQVQVFISTPPSLMQLSSLALRSASSGSLSSRSLSSPAASCWLLVGNVFRWRVSISTALLLVQVDLNLPVWRSPYALQCVALLLQPEA